MSEAFIGLRWAAPTEGWKKEWLGSQGVSLEKSAEWMSKDTGFYFIKLVYAVFYDLFGRAMSHDKRKIMTKRYRYKKSEVMWDPSNKVSQKVIYYL